MRCRVCRHPERSAIEAACDVATLAEVAERYELSELALTSHFCGHPRLALELSLEDDEPMPETQRSPGVAA